MELESRRPKNGIGMATEDLLVIKGFRAHLRALTDPTVLDLLFIARLEAMKNADVRKTLSLQRSGTYKQLTKLADLTLLRKVGNEYRTTEYACGLVRSISVVLRGALKGQFPLAELEEEDGGPKKGQSVEGSDAGRLAEVCRMAAEGSEYMFNRGAIQEAERDRRQRLIAAVQAGTGNGVSETRGR